jgi:hypothetical protein
MPEDMSQRSHGVLSEEEAEEMNRGIMEQMMRPSNLVRSVSFSKEQIMQGMRAAEMSRQHHVDQSPKQRNPTVAELKRRHKS